MKAKSNQVLRSLKKDSLRALGERSRLVWKFLENLRSFVVDDERNGAMLEHLTKILTCMIGKKSSGALPEKYQKILKWNVFFNVKPLRRR